MESFENWVTFWATIVGTVVGVLGAFQSSAWLVGVGIVMACGSVVVLIYARRQRARVRSASVAVDGLSLDSLNAASLRRGLNRSLIVQEVENVAVIDGEDLAVAWTCSGYCAANRETSMAFSIDADANTPFRELDCFAFDLRRDPERRYPIRPILAGPDGISKKIAIPFLAPLAAQEPFHIMLRWRQRRCMRYGVDYYAATLSFAQKSVRRYAARLVFKHGRPRWVRVYGCLPGDGPRLVRVLRPQAAATVEQEYIDGGENVTAQSARIYVFERRPSGGY